MAHEVEFIDGTPLAVMNRTPAWWMVGDEYGKVWRDDAPLTLDVAMKEARLANWNVRTVPVLGHDSNGDLIATDERLMTVRDNLHDPLAPAEFLGVVGPDYSPVQNEDAFAGAEALVDEGLVVESAASLRGGTQPFVLFRMPEAVSIGGDKVMPYIAVMTSHDGTLAVTYQTTRVRIVCANTQAWALSQHEPRFTVRHVGSDSLEGRLAEAREALRISWKSNEDWAREMNEWAAHDVTRREFDKITEGLFPDLRPEEETKRRLANLQERREGFRNLHDSSATTEGIRGTAYGALQAALEWDEWYRGSTQGVARATRSILAQGQTREHAANVIRDVAFA